MLRKTFCIIALTFFSTGAQTINLRGVISSPDKKPVSGAIVTLVRQNLKDTTGSDGKYAFIGTSVKELPAIIPQSSGISLKNNILQFSINTQSSLKVEIFDLKGKLLNREVKQNAAAGMYQFDISKNCQATKVFFVKASIGNKEITFRSTNIKGGQYASTHLNTASAISSNSGLAKVAAIVDTIKVSAPSYLSNTLAISSLDQELNITIEPNTAGKEWPTANPAAAGPFEVTADKNVGPLAGVVPDPIYGNQQQRFNVYRPKDLATSGYLHPILIWANGYTDNPEQNPPLCVTNASAGKWCGQYLPMMNHLASHGFVVVASLSTATGSGNPLPTIVGMDWIIKQNEDPSSPYYHRLDTSKIGQLGHSFGGMSTCMSASDPRYKALATICGTRELSGVHTPMMFFCGGKDNTVKCDGVRNTFLSVKNQPAFFINELNADHGSWVYQGAKGVSLSAAAAWFRVFLMNDTANRKFFFGSNCTFCSDSRVKVEQNSLMAQ